MNLAKEMKYSLSGDDIKRLTDGKCNIMTYPELNKYNSIRDVLGKYKALVILYLTSSNYGHWVCVFERDNNTIEFFDSYGYFPDDELNVIQDKVKRELNQMYPQLTKLLYNSGYKKIEYNEKQLQKFSPDINTCGRWVCIVLALRHMPLKQFQQIFGVNGDQKVTELTSK